MNSNNNNAGWNADFQTINFLKDKIKQSSNKIKRVRAGKPRNGDARRNENE